MQTIRASVPLYFIGANSQQSQKNLRPLGSIPLLRKTRSTHSKKQCCAQIIAPCPAENKSNGTHLVRYALIPVNIVPNIGLKQANWYH